MLLNFGVGVVTGLPLEFEFGTNWAQACGVAAARYAHKADSLSAEIQTALREQGALINGDDLPDLVALQYS